jgi:hypothetical protein
MNPTTPQSIIEKIRKLQALADNAGTEHEAAVAADRVAELCRQHNLDIGVATLVEEEKEASEARHEHAGRWSAHYSGLSAACGEVFHVGHYKKACGIVQKDGAGRIIGSKDGSALVFFGLKANVQAATETYEYLLASVEAMLESHIRAGGRLSGVSDFRAFRIGCATRIYQEATKIKEAGRQIAAQSEECNALVRLENQLMAAHRTKLHLRSGGGYRVSHGDAYSAGYSAGGRVDFHGARSSRMIGG